MNNSRKVGLRVLFNLIKSKRPIGLMGLIFTIFSLLVLLPLVVILTTTLKAPYEKYDFEQLEKNGTEKTAKILRVDTAYNINYNGQNPKVITYKYINNGRQVIDKFQSLDPQIKSVIANNSEVTILVNGEQSTIKGLEPFSFPFNLFLILPLVFLLVGSVLLLIGLIPALKIFRLYKHGIVKDAYVISVNSGGGMGMFPFSLLKQSLLVHYYYLNSRGEKLFGESTTTDLLILNEVKAGDIIKIFVAEHNENSSYMVPKYESLRYQWAL